MTECVLTHPENHEPTEFTLAMLDWLPWLAPPADDALTERQRTSLVDPARSKSAYFRLLASDPDILEARTRTDKDIFYTEVCICELRKWLIWLSELAISFSGYWTRMGSRLSRLKAASCSGVVLA